MSDPTYHELSSYDRRRLGGTSIDWFDRPRPYKLYKGLKYIDLPLDETRPHTTLSEILSTSLRRFRRTEFSLRKLALILGLGSGLTKKAVYGEEELYYRACPSAGALYPCEVYVAGFGLDELPAALFYYDVSHHRLILLRGMDGIPGYGLMFFITGIFFRSAWKYGIRGYRYVLLDAGHLLENLRLSTKMVFGSCFLSLDFDDDSVNAFLGIDTNREACLAVCGPEDTKKLAIDSKVKPVQPEASKVAERDIVDPLIVNAHLASCRRYHPRVGRKSVDIKSFLRGIWDKEVREWVELDSSVSSERDFVSAVRNRRSKRSFFDKRLPYRLWSKILLHLCEDMPSQARCGGDMVLTGFLGATLEGVRSGFYFLDRIQRRIGMVKPGDLRDQLAHACLGQMWLAKASLLFVFLLPLRTLDDIFGARGYRFALIEAGRLGERVYLSATGIGLGACGIGAFFDREVREVLGLGENLVVVYLVAVGYSN